MMQLNLQVHSDQQNTDTGCGLAEACALADVFCSSPAPQAVPVRDWSPLVKTADEYTSLETTSLTVEQLMEVHFADMMTPLVEEQQSFLRPSSPVDSQPQPGETHLEVRLRPIGSFDGNMIYGTLADKVLPTANTRSSQRRARVSMQDDDGAYVKKPPNAFMLYRKEQTPKVAKELRNSDCAAVNTVIGQMWRALSHREQQKYYEESARLRETHSQLHPGWSARDNYGKKRKRSPRRIKATNYSDSRPGRRGRPRFAPLWRDP